MLGAYFFSLDSMSPEQQIVTSADDLVRYYRGTNPEEKLYVGIELERSGVHRDSLAPVRYDEEGGYVAIMRKLVDEVGWNVTEEEDGVIYALQRGDTAITVEPDGRPELSGSPKENLHDLAREFRLHDNELMEMGNLFGVAWLPLGLQPFATNDDIVSVPKRRYRIMFDSVPKDQVSFLLTHHRRMNGVHVNMSTTTEENAIAKAQTLMRILPVVTAMFASSPFEQGERSDFLDLRRHYNIRFHPERTRAIPSDILRKDFCYRDWIDYYLDIPVMIIRKKEGDIHPSSLTFRQWMEQGYEGSAPTPYDFDQHIKTTWSDIRLRPSYLEFRAADASPYRLTMSLAALLKGLIFDSNSWQAVESLTKDWTFEDILDADERAWKTGLQTVVHGRTLLAYAQELITLSNEKLHAFGRTTAAEEDEAVFLTPLKEQIYIKEKSPAEEMVALWETEWNHDPRRILEWCERS